MSIAGISRGDSQQAERHDEPFRLLDGIDTIAFIVAIDTHEVLFANKWAKRILGDHAAKKCWQFLSLGQESPCLHCERPHPPTQPDDSIVLQSWDFQNAASKNWYTCKESRTQWPDGRPARIGIATDITPKRTLQDILKTRIAEDELLGRISSLEYIGKPNRQTLKEISESLPSILQKPDKTCTLIRIGKRRYPSQNFKKTDWSYGLDIKRKDGGRCGRLYVFYMDRPKDNAAGMDALGEERLRIQQIALKLGHYLETVRREKKRKKNASLLTIQKLACDAQEEERHRLAMELHDGPIQHLLSAKLFADISHSAPETARKSLQICSESLGQACQDLRDICENLHPATLSDYGFETAILRILENVQKKTGISLASKIDLSDSIPKETAHNLYRIIQEIISNVIRHSRADRVAFNLSQSGSTILLRVEDNGVGFDPGCVRSDGKTNHGRGLLGIRDRVKWLGGTTIIHARPGYGTTIELSVRNGEER